MTVATILSTHKFNLSSRQGIYKQQYFIIIMPSDVLFLTLLVVSFECILTDGRNMIAYVCKLSETLKSRWAENFSKIIRNPNLLLHVQVSIDLLHWKHLPGLLHVCHFVPVIASLESRCSTRSMHSSLACVWNKNNSSWNQGPKPVLKNISTEGQTFTNYPTSKTWIIQTSAEYPIHVCK